jgi:hypothetical protein
MLRRPWCASLPAVLTLTAATLIHWAPATAQEGSAPAPAVPAAPLVPAAPVIVGPGVRIQVQAVPGVAVRVNAAPADENAAKEAAKKAAEKAAEKAKETDEKADAKDAKKADAKKTDEKADGKDAKKVEKKADPKDTKKPDDKKPDDKKPEEPAEPPAMKASIPRANEVEVRLGDGSAVRMVVLQENVTLNTPYGKLTIPTKQIRKIDFGLRLPEETTKKVDAAIKRLAGDNFDAREEATKELISLGAAAYPALRDASESADPEISQRARKAMRAIREKVPAGQLPSTTNDRIETVLFTVAGVVSDHTLKAESYFGVTDVKIADIRSVRWMSANTEVEIVVDASKYGGGGNQWLDTKITVESDVGLVVTASGQVNLNQDGGGDFTTGPAGNGNWGRRGQYLPGALLGKIGDKGSTFVVGEKYEGVPSQEGKLFLQIAPSPWNQSSGTYKVKITMGRNVTTGEK